MANPIHVNTRAKDQRVPAPGLHRLLTLHTGHDTAMAPSIRLGSWFDKDAPKDYFTATSGSLKTPSLTDHHSLKQETDSMYLARERTDSEKAVKGSDDESMTDGRVTFQDDTVKELARHIPNDSSEELYRRGQEAEAIINGTDRAFNGHFGSHFDMDSNDLGLWPLAASNREEAKAMVEGLERAHGKSSCHRLTYSTDTTRRSDTVHSLEAVNRRRCMYPSQRHTVERESSSIAREVDCVYE